MLIAIRQKAKQLSPADLPVISQALGGELKTSMGLPKVGSLLPLASSFDNPDSITQVILGPPYTHGCGCPETYLNGDWGLILPLVHQYFP